MTRNAKHFFFFQGKKHCFRKKDFIFSGFLKHSPSLTQTCVDLGVKGGIKAVKERKETGEMKSGDSGLTLLQNAKQILQSYN